MEKRSPVMMAAAIKFSEYNAGQKCWFECTTDGTVIMYAEKAGTLLIPPDAGNWHYNSKESCFESIDGRRIMVKTID